MGKAGIGVKIDSDDKMMPYAVTYEYTEAIDELASLRVHLRLGPHADLSAVLKKLVPGKTFKVELLDGTSPKFTGTGDVVEVSHRRSNGNHEVTVFGLDALHRLTAGAPKAMLWEATADKIAKDIASAHGLTGSAEGVDTTASVVLQRDVSDALFLLQLARQHNYTVSVNDKKLNFARRSTTKATVTLEENDVIDMRLRASVKGLVTKVTVHGDDYLQDKAVTGAATSADTANITSSDTGVAAVKKAFKDIELVLNQTGIADQSSAKAVAKAELQRRAENYVTGTLIVPGNPAATSGNLVKIKGGVWPFTGPFLIRQSRHVYDIATGYRTFIDFQSDSLPTAS